MARSGGGGGGGGELMPTVESIDEDRACSYVVDCARQIVDRLATFTPGDKRISIWWINPASEVVHTTPSPIVFEDPSFTCIHVETVYDEDVATPYLFVGDNTGALSIIAIGKDAASCKYLADFWVCNDSEVVMIYARAISNDELYIAVQLRFPNLETRTYGIQYDVDKRKVESVHLFDTPQQVTSLSIHLAQDVERCMVKGGPSYLEDNWTLVVVSQQLDQVLLFKCPVDLPESLAMLLCHTCELKTMRTGGNGSIGNFTTTRDPKNRIMINVLPNIRFKARGCKKAFFIDTTPNGANWRIIGTDGRKRTFVWNENGDLLSSINGAAITGGTRCVKWFAYTAAEGSEESEYTPDLVLQQMELRKDSIQYGSSGSDIVDKWTTTRTSKVKRSSPGTMFQRLFVADVSDLKSKPTELLFYVDRVPSADWLSYKSFSPNHFILASVNRIKRLERYNKDVGAKWTW